MKKLFLAVCSLGITGAGHAQITPRTQLFSGSINYAKTERESRVVTAGGSGSSTVKGDLQQFMFAPLVGFFAAPNLAVGVQGSVDLSKGTGFHPVVGNANLYNSTQDQSTTLSVGPFGRYYTFLGDQVAVYGQLGAGYRYSHYQAEAVGSNGMPYDGKGNGVYAQLLPGIVFFPTNKLGLELALNGATYTRTRIKGQNGPTFQDETTHSDLNLGVGLTDVRLGISLYPGR